ncbi:hypothetical protein ncot_01275 [Nocardioides sp. JQ2195]|uniref:hypothetical protein n=1 Tax=Nocardioides sp. JQ2195 TaxID=2592334 RepID=UPI00143E96F2|nr:hypothetical protein [Nocardioides sp. JQ2195]QIX25369.1 hypothetical protein ncot_01275 [Nocardioides sp. JQ2195]
MDSYNSYYTEAEATYRRERANQIRKPVRRSRRERAQDRALDRAQRARRSMGDDLAS